MRTAPPLHPQAVAVGAAPRHSGRWVTVWATADGWVCTTVGALPGDAASTRRSERFADGAVAHAAALARLAELWDAYVADHAGPRDRWTAGLCPHPLREAPALPPLPTDAPVPAGVARAAVRDCFARCG